MLFSPTEGAMMGFITWEVADGRFLSKMLMTKEDCKINPNYQSSQHG